MKRMTQKSPALLCFLAIAAVLSGCMGFNRGVGETVALERRLPLEHGGPHTGAWVGRDLVFSYAYVREGDRMTVDGTIDFRGSVGNFSYMRSFYLQAYYLNPAGQVIAVSRIYNGGRGKAIETWRFTRNLALPPAAVGWAIGYSGNARDNGPPGDEVDWTFWDTPFK
jgi:hypothetical protein